MPENSDDSAAIRSSVTTELEAGETPTVEIHTGVRQTGLKSGDVFHGRYRIETLIGHGGFSDVFRALDQENGDVVALKFLADRQSGEKIVDRMRRELRLARDLRHPNIVRVYELMEIEGSCCLVMEYVEGRTLKDVVVDHGRMKVNDAFRTLSGLCSALAAVHEAGIVHRDLKPQNVMLTDAGEIKLLDFGLARTPDSTGLTATGTILGTPDYMSPEQVDGRTADERSDLYSLGVMAYELLVGQPPFTGDKAISIALQHLRSRVPDPRREHSEVPIELARLVRDMTEPNPARRPSSAQALLMRLERLGSQEMGRTTMLGQVRFRTRRTWVVAAAIGLAVVISGGAFSMKWLSTTSAAAEGADPLADGIVAVSFASRQTAQRSASAMFLNAVAEGAEERLDGSVFSVVDEGSSTDMEALWTLGVEHFVELSLSADSTETGRSYQLQAKVLDTRDGTVWKVLPASDLGALDFEAVAEVSDHLAESYQQVVREAMN